MERYLLDTMTVLWMAFEPERIGKDAAVLLESADTDLSYSVISLWEIGLKMGRGGYHGFQLPQDWHQSITQGLADQGITERPIRPAHCRRLQDLPLFHKDPFDRMLIAQSLEENWCVIGCDTRFDEYGVRRRW
jgi:PIN domain nuclease of toxin-antitoxin system